MVGRPGMVPLDLSPEEKEAMAWDILQEAKEERDRLLRQEEEKKLAELEAARAKAQIELDTVTSQQKQLAADIDGKIAGLLAKLDEWNAVEAAKWNIRQRVSDGDHDTSITKAKERAGVVLRYHFSTRVLGIDAPHPGLVKHWSTFGNLI